MQKCPSALDNTSKKASADCWMRLKVVSVSIQVAYATFEMFSRPVCDGSEIRSCADVPPLS